MSRLVAHALLHDTSVWEVEDVFERVSRGAEALDVEHPGWAEMIDLSELQLSDECNCVVGQLSTQVVPGYRYGSFVPEEVLSFRYNLSDYDPCDFASMLGFDIYSGSDDNEAAYALLQEAWLDEIMDRL